MTFTLAQRLIAVGALCLAALIGLVVMEGRARAAGTEVLLRMQPVDPRALLTGHYVMLSFADQLEPGEPCPPLRDHQASPNFFRADDGQNWLALKPDGDVHVLAGEYATKAEALAHAPIAARGAASCSTTFRQIPGATDGAGDEVATVFLHLSIDRFHADQDEAEALEAILRDRTSIDRVAAIVSVGSDGAVRTKGVMVDDKRVELTWF
ncbi:MAG: GDYXXLXY domain-containing protein [Hyphomonadaceae bacterium]|nr:GDYXXLXY domain-containing protein [Hyphomonadaceae bacterium]